MAAPSSISARTRAPHRNTKPAFEQALTLFKKAATRVPAYKDFLRKAKINPEKIKTPKDFAHIPPTDKPTYISAYSLEELSWDGTLQNSKYVSSSSGSTGVPFYWPRGTKQDEMGGSLFQRIYEDIFSTTQGNTLFVNLFGLGVWIAGLEFYNAAKFVADKGSAMTIVTPGIEKGAALAIIQRLAPSFDRIILAGYPPFIKDVLDSGTAEGVAWKKCDVRLFTAGESFSELWRNHVLELIGKKGSLAHCINLYGMAETGIVGHETPLSIFTRRTQEKIPELATLLSHDGSAAALYQYDPRARYFEVGEDNTLMLTAPAGLPLIRYNTRDRGGILKHAELTSLLAPHLSQSKINLQEWRMPFVYLYGRRDLSLSFYALMIYVENIKRCLETYAQVKEFSGLFSMRVGHTKKFDQQFEIVVELARGGAAPAKADLTKHVVRTLRSINSEYAKLSDSIGQRRTLPAIQFVRYGEIDTLPGRKHRWVKRG